MARPKRSGSERASLLGESLRSRRWPELDRGVRNLLSLATNSTKAKRPSSLISAVKPVGPAKSEYCGGLGLLAVPAPTFVGQLRVDGN